MDARRCISYLTIELRGAIPEELRAPMGRHVFGCDICQDVCPWNRRAPWTGVRALQPRVFSQQALHGESRRESGETFYHARLEWLASLSEDDFRSCFRGSPIRRTKWVGMLRNACIALGNLAPRLGPAARDRISALLGRLAVSPRTVVSESARWALHRMTGGENRLEGASGRKTAV